MTIPSIGERIDRVLDVDFRLLECGFGRDDGGFRLRDDGFAAAEIGMCFVQGEAGGFQIGRRNDLLGGQLFGARQLRLGVFDCRPELEHLGLRAQGCGLRLAVCGLCHAQLRHVRRRVEPGDHLAGVHQRVVIGGERLDDPGYFGADLHRRFRLHGAGRDHAADDWSGGDRRGRHLHFRCRMERPDRQTTERDRGHDSHPEPFQMPFELHLRPSN